MKKFNLSKELLLNGMLIGVLSIGLASCGGGGGGGSGSTSLSFGGSGPSTPTSPGGSGPSTPTSFSVPLYAGTDYPNEPIIKVYIDGQPVKLLADTGSSGLVVNSSAVNIPTSDIYVSYTFAIPFSLNDSYYGYIEGPMASATVCLNPSIPNSCVKMPIGLIQPYTSVPNAFPATGEAQGDFGLASALNTLDFGFNNSDSSISGFSYPTYLERQYGINSYTISFYPLSNGYYSDVSSTTPIGYISFGVYNGNSNTLISYTMTDFLSQPFTIVVFPSSNPNTTSLTSIAAFDTGSSYNVLDTSVFQTEIPSFNQTLDENACASYTNNGFLHDVVNGGYSITYSLPTNSGSSYIGSFTTEPSTSFCEANIPFTLMEGVTNNDSYVNGQFAASGLFGGEIFGLPAMLGHTFTWVLYRSGSNQGFVKGISISP